MPLTSTTMKSNTTSPDTTVIFLKNDSSKKNEISTPSEFVPENPAVVDAQSPVDQVYLIGGNYDKRTSTAGKYS